VSATALALELPGDWTSARLLVRILYTIGSDWELTEVGLVHRERGDACTISMRGADAALQSRYRLWEDPAYPSFMEEDYAGLDDHKAIVQLTPGAGSVQIAAARALLRCGAALVDGGARAVAVPGPQLAHSAERWQQLARLAEQDPSGPGGATALLRAFVRLAERHGDVWRTRGLAQLGSRDIFVDGDIDETYAFEMQQALAHRQLAGPGLEGDEILQAGQQGPRVRVRSGDGADGKVWHLESA